MRLILLSWKGSLIRALKEERVSLKEDLAKLIMKERVSWNQKCKIKWAKDGDCNRELLSIKLELTHLLDFLTF